MAITRVQTPTLVKVTAANSTTISFGSNVTAGNFILVWISTWQGAMTGGAVTDGLGNTYTMTDEVDVDVDSHCSMWYAKNINGGACTITVNPTGVLATIVIAAAEYSGIDPTSPLDQHNAVSGSSGDSRQSGNLVTTQADELIVGNLTHTDSGTITPNAAYTEVAENEDNNIYQALSAVEKIVAATSTYNVLWDVSPANWGIVAATFKASLAVATSLNRLAGSRPTLAGYGGGLVG